MSWICPWCGRENEQDERIGRREPICRLCGESRLTPEELEKQRTTTMEKLERELTNLKKRMEGIHDKVFSVSEYILELEQERDGYKEELEELKAETVPIEIALSEWKDQLVFYEKLDGGIIADLDKAQTKLPLEGAIAA